MAKVISVVIPVYNGITYIKKTIDSIINQTYKDLQIIIIDDFSTDGSDNYLKEIGLNDERVQIIHPNTKMGNASKSIEYVFNLIKGDYFFYMSQDDFIDLDFFEKCIDVATTSEPDIIVPNCVFYWEEENTKKKFSRYPINDDYSKNIQPKDAFLESLTWKIHANTLRKTELIRKIGFEGKYYNSDEYYGRLVFLKSQKISFVNTNFYYRQDNKTAITKQFKYYYIDIIITYTMLYKELIKNNYSKTNCKDILKDITKNYLRITKKIIVNKMLFENKCYALKKIIHIFFIIAIQWFYLILFYSPNMV